MKQMVAVQPSHYVDSQTHAAIHELFERVVAAAGEVMKQAEVLSKSSHR